MSLNAVWTMPIAGVLGNDRSAPLSAMNGIQITHRVISMHVETKTIRILCAHMLALLTCQTHTKGVIVRRNITAAIVRHAIDNGVIPLIATLDMTSIVVEDSVTCQPAITIFRHLDCVVSGAGMCRAHRYWLEECLHVVPCFDRIDLVDLFSISGTLRTGITSRTFIRLREYVASAL